MALGSPKPFHQQSLSDVEQVMQTNIMGVMYVTHATLNDGGMIAAGRGDIVNISSITGLDAPPVSVAAAVILEFSLLGSLSSDDNVELYCRWVKPLTILRRRH